MKLESKLFEESLMFEELKLKYYKDLLKCLYGEEPDKQTFLTTIFEICSKITDKPKSFFENLNFIEFLMLLIDLRMSILGPTCKIIIDQNNKTMSLDLNFNILKEDLIQAFKEISKVVITDNNKIFVNLECPSLSRMFLNNFDQDCTQFIKKVSLKKESQLIEISIDTNNQAREIFEHLLPKLSIQIIEHSKTFLQTCIETNFFKRYNLKEQKTFNFMPSLESFIWFLKLIFNDSLTTIYENLFYLSYAGKMDLNYIENCTVGEYLFYVNTLKGVLDKQNSAPEQQPQMNENFEDEQELTNSE